MDAGFSAVINPLQLVKQGKRLKGQLVLQVLPRLAAFSSKPATGKVDVDLQFDRGEDQQNRVTGSASACFDVICQRCLEPMSLQLDTELNMLLVDSREHVIENSNGIVCKGKMPVAELIEDDLLLAMPMFPKHQAGDCKIKQGQLKPASNNTGSNKGPNEDREDNPFAVLAVLKSGTKTGKGPGKKSGKKSGKK